MVQMGTVRVTDKGEVTLEMDFQSMKFAGMTGYLYKMKIVDMDTVEYNKYNYPVKYEASDATILEEYTDVYDLFNSDLSTASSRRTSAFTALSSLSTCSFISSAVASDFANTSSASLIADFKFS